MLCAFTVLVPFFFYSKGLDFVVDNVQCHELVILYRV